MNQKRSICTGRIAADAYSAKKIGVAEGVLKDSDGNLYAHATATCMIHR